VPAVLTDKYNPAFNNAYDYQDMFYQNGSTQNYDLSMEGGNSSNSYRISLGHYNEKGVLVGYGLSRTKPNASLVSDVNKYFHNELIIRYSYLDAKASQRQNEGNAYFTHRAPSSLFYRTPEELRQLSGQLGDAYNKNRSHSLSLGETLRIKFLENLTLDNQVSTILDFGKRDYFIPSTATTDNKSVAYSSASMTMSMNANSVLNFNTTLGKNGDHAILSWQVWKQTQTISTNCA
jgi:hypothetical protein